MMKSRFTEQQIIGFLKQAEAGLAVKEVCRQGGFSEPTFYKWRAKYGGMDAEEVWRLKELEVENARLKKLLAEAHLDLEALKIGFGVSASPAGQAQGHCPDAGARQDLQAQGLPSCGALPRCWLHPPQLSACTHPRRGHAAAVLRVSPCA